MTKIQSAKLNALLALQSLLTASKPLVATIPALEEAVDSLIDLILEINLNVKIQAEPSGASKAKRDALIELGDAAFEVAGAVLSFAEKSGDANLAAKVDFPRSGVTAGSGNAIVARCQTIIESAAANIESLDEHGVTQTKVNALKQKLKTYDLLRPMPRNTIGAGAAATASLEQLFPAADQLLEKRIDRVIWQFRTSQPDFFQKYQVARRIVSPATTGAEGADTAANVVAAPNTVPDTKAA